MPLYRFICDQCETEEKRIVNVIKITLDCNCGGKLHRQLPIDISSETLEMRDRYRGVQLPKNQEKKMKKRFRDHHKKYEMAEKIDKQGIDTADRLGWTKKD